MNNYLFILNKIYKYKTHTHNGTHSKSDTSITTSVLY